MNVRGFSGWFFVLLLAASAANAATTLEKIAKARAQGRLSGDQAILLKVQSLKNAETLPLEYASDEPLPERCATRVSLEAMENWDSYSPSTQTALRQALTRPVQQQSYTSPDSFFLIHYDITGTHAVPLTDQDLSGVPDYVENLALYADSSYRMEVLQLGYRPPPFDGTGLYDIYTQEIPYYGYCVRVSNQCSTCPSFIVVHCNFFGFPPNDDPEGDQKGAMKVTLAHELHHAVQFGYLSSVSSHIWFMEITSTWMEDVVFDLVNDSYNYLPYFFDIERHLPLTDDLGIHMYASFIWNQYLAQNFGRDIIRQIWEQNQFSNSFHSMNLILQNLGSDLGREFSRFALWNFYTGSRNDGQHYEEGGFYPEMVLHRNVGGPIFSGRSDTIVALAAQYEAFLCTDTIEKGQLTFTGQTSGVWGAHVILQDSLPVRAHPFNLASNSVGDTTFFGLDSFPQVVLVAAQIKISQPTVAEYFDYHYKAFPFYIPGDLNEDLLVTILDIILQIDYVFLEIPPPENHLGAADLNCDGGLTATDVVLILNLVYLSLNPPC